MDNIKKFEDFLDRMQGLLDNAKKQGRIIVPVEDLENAFPELKESDDERIRKVIIEHFEGSHSCMYPYKGFTKEQILAWLKKQGDIIENNMLLPFKEYDNLMDSINKKKKEGYEAGYKQGLIDSKNDQHVQPKFKVGDTIRIKSSSAEYVITDIYGGCYHGKGWSLDIISADRSGDYELVEQKPAWSEEDEYMFNSFLHKLEVCGLLSNQEIIWIKNKFKSLKERVQPKQGWNEEDEEMLEDVKFNFEYNKGEMTDAMIAQYNRFFDKIKSLKPQAKPVWSAEDEKKRTLLIDILTVNHPNDYFKVNPVNTLNMEAMHTEELVSWLESLKQKIKGE